MTDLRPGLPPMPPAIAQLPLDHRGYPVPYFVYWNNGVADFRILRPGVIREAIQKDLCWICGQRKGRYSTFVIGPMCCINRVAPEPPSHLDCATFAVKACPFLMLPNAQRREATLPDNAQPTAGIMITRNPGVALVWTTKHFTITRAPGGVLFDVGIPYSYSWYAEGRPATRDEVLASLNSGLPILEKAAKDDSPQAVVQLRKQIAASWRYLPQE